MKISKRTRDILNSFNKINTSIMLSENNIIRQKLTGNDNRLFAMAKIEENFPNFMINNLSDFLEILNAIGDDANLEFSETDVLISSDDGSRKFKFKGSPEYMEDELLKSMRQKNTFDISTKDDSNVKEIHFELDTNSIMDMLKVTASIPPANTTSHAYSFYGDGQSFYLSLGRIINDNNSHEGNVYDEKLGETTENFRFDIDVKTFKMMNGKYKASLKWGRDKDTNMDSGILFTHTEDGLLKYWNVFQTTSVFPKVSPAETTVSASPSGDACGITRPATAPIEELEDSITTPPSGPVGGAGIPAYVAAGIPVV